MHHIQTREKCRKQAAGAITGDEDKKAEGRAKQRAPQWQMKRHGRSRRAKRRLKLRKPRRPGTVRSVTARVR